MGLIVEGMKLAISSPRPSGAAGSMPSGHTAQAFVSATILDMEYRDSSPWISVSGYALAATTGLYRIINNKHWISDVFVGAGIGMLSTRLVYSTHKVADSKKRMVLFPTLVPKGAGISFAMIF
jgi:membrane-associated phospholipid phosphatase